MYVALLKNADLMKWKKMNENAAAGSYSKDTYINFFFSRNNMQNNLWKLYKNQEKQILNIFIKKISRKEIQQHFHWVSIKKSDYSHLPMEIARNSL